MRQTKKDQKKKNEAANTHLKKNKEFGPFKEVIRVPPKRENPYKKEENHIKLYRGTKINRAELF